jgi:hypothetical protein
MPIRIENNSAISSSFEWLNEPKTLDVVFQALRSTNCSHACVAIMPIAAEREVASRDI